jgi:mannose-1-phosphate guanylyltransferase
LKRGEIGWADLGSHRPMEQTGKRPVVVWPICAAAYESHVANNLVRDQTSGAPRKRWALLGVSDLVIVETDDAVLVVPRDRAQDVRAVVDALAKTGEADKL